MSFRLRLCILLLLAACSAPPPPPLPVFAFTVQHFAGPALAGPVAQRLLPAQQKAQGEARAMPLLIAELFLLPEPPAVAEPLALHTRVVVRAAGAQPFASHPHALTAVRVLQGEEAANLQRDLAAAQTPLTTAQVPLPAGVSTVLGIDANAAATGLAHCLLTHEPDDVVHMALATPDGEEEVLLTPAPTAGGPPLVLWLPAAAALPALGLVVRVDPSPAGEQEAAAAAAAAEAATQAATAATAAPDRRTQMLRAHADLLQHLVQAEPRRSSLLALAQRVGATCCADFALSADTAALARLCASLDSFDAAAATAAQRFQLDHACLQVLLPGLQRDELQREEAAFLLRWCGAVGRRASRLEEVLEAATGCDDLAARLVAANRDFLRENDPAGRVHAYDWLAARGQAPPGFDPLGTREQRRQALEATESGAGR